MADEEPVYQFLVTSAEMKLLHTLRATVPEEETEENQAKLQSAVHLMAYAGDRHLGDFSVDGNSLVTGCADVGAQIRDRILHDEAEPGTQEDPNIKDEPTAPSTTDGINDLLMDEPVPWDEVRSQVIPPYVHNVIFAVSKDDMKDEHRKELAERFPDVIVRESGSNRSAKRQAAPDHPAEKPAGVKNAVFELNKDCSTTAEAEIRNQYPWAKLKPFVYTLNRIQQVLETNAESTPTTPSAASPTISGTFSVEHDSKSILAPPTGPRTLTLAARMSRETLPPDFDPTDFDLGKSTDINDLARCLGLEGVRSKYIRPVYAQWERKREIHLYILAHALKNEPLQYAILLQFQVTNFEQSEELPYLHKFIFRAFKHLPVQSPLCRWMAILFSHEPDALHDGDYDSFSGRYGDVDPTALNKFLYGVAAARDPRSKRGKHGMLEQWCSVHQHLPESEEDDSCMKAERICKNTLLTRNSPDYESPDRLTKKRSSDGPLGYSKRFKPNESYHRDR